MRFLAISLLVSVPAFAAPEKLAADATRLVEGIHVASPQAWSFYRSPEAGGLLPPPTRREFRELVGESSQLRRLQDLKESDPLFDLSWRGMKEGFGLRREDVLAMDTRQYFLAILNGLDRVQPELRKRQIEETRSREIVSIRIDGASAEMKTKATSGAVESYTWTKEGGTWRCRADVSE